MDTEWIKEQLRARRRSISTLAKRVGRDRSAVSRIVNGDQPLPLWMVKHFATELGASEADILQRAGLDVPNIVYAPLISWVAASQFTTVDAPVFFGDEYLRIAVDRPSSSVFVLEVVGDSMDVVAPAGSLILVDYAQKDLEDRDLAVFAREGETTFKRFRSDEKGVWLPPNSFSDRHSPIVPSEDDEINVVGRVVAIPRLVRT